MYFCTNGRIVKGPNLLKLFLFVCGGLASSRFHRAITVQKYIHFVTTKSIESSVTLGMFPFKVADTSSEDAKPVLSS